MEYENKKVGSELPPIGAKPVSIMSYEEVEITSNDKVIGTKLVLRVNHPEVGEIEISKVRYEKAKKLKESGIWLNLDKDGNIPFNSALAEFLRHYKFSSIADMKDKIIETVADEGGFLIAKAY